MFSIKNNAASRAKTIFDIEQNRALVEQKAQERYSSALQALKHKKEAALQDNQRLYEINLAKIKSHLDSEVKTGQGYEQTAKEHFKTLYKQKILDIEADYTKSIKQEEHNFYKEILKIEHQYHQWLLSENKAYQSLLQRRENKIKAAERPFMYTLFADQKARNASLYQIYKLQSDALHAEAVSAHNAAVEEFYKFMDLSLVDSYRMVAKEIGLNGVTDDINKFVSSECPYNSVQPLVIYEQLICALQAAFQQSERSQLLLDFYQLTGDGMTESSPILQEIVQSLHLDMDTKFLDLIHSNTEFRTHVHQTMAKYNQRLAHENGWESMPLTKQHLYNSSYGTSPLEQTPYGVAKKEHDIKISTISRDYRAKEAELKKAHEQAIADAKFINANERQALERLEKAKEEIMDETEWDILAAEIDASLEAFHYLAAPAAVIVDTKSCVKTNNRPFFNKKIANPLQHDLPPIPENDADDSEICAILNPSRAW